MEDFTRLNVNEFLDKIADRTPTPGGGAVAAATGALACALAKMVTNYSVGKKTEEGMRKRIEELAIHLHRTDAILRALITQDAIAYKQMTQAAKSAKKDPSKQGDFQKAILSAIGVPMETAATASNALATMDAFKTLASRYLLSDLGVAAVLAEAAARAAAYSVRINLHELTDPSQKTRIASEIDTIIAHCRDKRDAIEAYVNGQLES